MSTNPFNPALIPPGVSAGPDGAGSVRDRTQPVRPSVQTPQGPAFSDVLRDTAGTTPVTFSKHAVQRLERRQLTVDPTTMQRLQDGVDRAAGKGARDAVVLVDDTAFVVSVTNRTVVTAVGKDQMKDHVFTNIDSAVIA
jgi:flagellar operon protein